MRVQVVSTEQGRIVSISRLGDVGEQVSGIEKAGVFPDSGQRVDLVELDEKYQEVPLLELHQRLRLDTSHRQPRLVSAEDFTEPYLREPRLAGEGGEDG